jgi:ABC-2 type transport system ATP-binding protein
VTQSNTLDRSLDLWENLYYHCRYFGWSAGPARRRADELLERARLSDRRRSMPAAISGGMAQRLQIARAIAHRPDVLVLDEPTAGLDPQSRLALWELVEELRGDGITVLLTTHYMEEADRLCDRVAIIDHGCILVCDTPERLKAVHGAAAVVEVTLRDDPDPAALDTVLAELRALATVESVEVSAGRVRVMAASTEGLAAAVVSTVATRLELTDLTVAGSTLEAVFITLTGRDLRE